MEPFDSLKRNTYRYSQCDGRCNATPMYYNDKPIASMERSRDFFARIAPSVASTLAVSGHVRCQQCESWFHATWEPRDLYWFYQPLPNLAQPTDDKLRIPQDTPLKTVMQLFYSPWRSDAQLFFRYGRLNAEQALNTLINAISSAQSDYDRAELVNTLTALLALENPVLAERQTTLGYVWQNAPSPEFADCLNTHLNTLKNERFPKQLIRGYIADLERLAKLLRQDTEGSKPLFKNSHLLLF